MGVDYYLVSEGSEELFELGRGAWVVGGGPLEGFREMAEDVFSIYGEGGGHARRCVTAAVKWWRKHEVGGVKLVSDHDDEYERVREWPVTGSIFDIKKLSHEDIRERVEGIVESAREEFGAEHVSLVVRVEDMVLSDEGGQIEWEYVAAHGSSYQHSGYKRTGGFED